MDEKKFQVGEAVLVIEGAYSKYSGYIMYESHPQYQVHLAQNIGVMLPKPIEVWMLNDHLMSQKSEKKN